MEQHLPAGTAPRRYTADEYLRLEESSPVRHEFRDGERIAMAGGTFDHALIVTNVLGGLNARAPAGCVAVGNDLRVQVSKTRRYCYPDVVVVCGTPAFDPPDRRVTLVNPQVIVEVLSPGTADVDRGEKLTDYMGIASLQQYVLVAHDRLRVDTFCRRPDGSWATIRWAVGLDAAIVVPSLGIELPLATVYAGVIFPRVSEAAEQNP